MPADVTITKVRAPGGWLGNMAPYPVEYEGYKARTTEALFQAMRFGLQSEAAAKVLAETSPMGAKLRAKAEVKAGVTLFIEPRTDPDVRMMELCLRLKLEQHPQLQDWLLATGDALIVEDTTSRAARGRPDYFWGAVKTPEGIWRGENILGKLWMKLRSELQTKGAVQPTLGI